MSEHDVPAERDELREKLRHLTRDPGAPGGALRSQLAGDRSKGGGMTPYVDAPAVGRETLAWHFVASTLRDGRPVPADGVELRHDGPVVMCGRGLHASLRAIDALHYAPGAIACRVMMRDVVATAADKLVARSRTILWRVDATDVLREFTRDCALDVLHLWATPETPGIDTVVEYLLTGDESLRATARVYAWSAWAARSGWAARDARATVQFAARAARNAAGAARDAAGAARDARSVARDAWDVAWTARATAQLAARSGRAARDAWYAVWDAQSTRLERMLEAAR